MKRLMGLILLGMLICIPVWGAEKKVDFGPWMAEVQRKVRKNWEPPKEDQDKSAVVFFEVENNGRLFSVRVDKSTGSEAADHAAMEAVRRSAPFRPFPKGAQRKLVGVQFTFDFVSGDNDLPPYVDADKPTVIPDTPILNSDAKERLKRAKKLAKERRKKQEEAKPDEPQ